jgi:hypothetical protein
MSLQALKVSELKEIATEYGVDIAEAKNKADILAVLAEEGVTDELLNNLATVQKEELPPAPAFAGAEEIDVSDKTLVKMERMNRSYETHGYEFTQEHPFISMPMTSAMKILDTEKGFRLATPSEVKEFYS